jgi:hypothetical protein
MLPINAGLPILVGLLVGTVAFSAQAQPASPTELACHEEATKRYIADIHPVGAPHKESDEVVTDFVNDKLKYQDYYTECMGRWNSKKSR